MKIIGFGFLTMISMVLVRISSMRMTIGQLVECLVGKVAALQGMDADGTSFEEYDLASVKAKLKELGYEENGKEYLYNGMTGEKLKVMIYFGPTYYQRLKHLVEDKIHCLTMDHEVLTESGWKYFEAITKDDKVATLKKGKLVYEYPTELIHHKNYEGKMYRIETDKVDLCVTGNHRMWMTGYNKEYGFQFAEDINGRRGCSYKKNWDGVRSNISCIYKSFETDDKTVVDNTMKLMLELGYAADGIQTGDKKWMVNIYYPSNCDAMVTDETVISESMYDYKGPVFCLTVPSGVFYVRRNGKGVWTGNSRARGPKTSLTRQAPEGRSRDGGLRLGSPFCPQKQ